MFVGLGRRLAGVSGEKRGQQVRSKHREGGEAGNIDVYAIEAHGRSVGRNASQVK
jgi:hypothetical protein